ncbi:MAG: hypothetical protein H6581_19615 [Bacteroidia bacterium]|nr:hypothetical protein [Bacteroidia bacterium]
MFFAFLIAGFFALPSLYSQVKSNPPALTTPTVAKGSTTAPGFARITPEKQIYLDPLNPVQADYKADMSHLGFATQAAAESFFNNYSTVTVQFSVADKNTLNIHLAQSGSTQGWTVQNWNDHFLQKAQALKVSSH